MPTMFLGPSCNSVERAKSRYQSSRHLLAIISAPKLLFFSPDIPGIISSGELGRPAAKAAEKYKTDAAAIAHNRKIFLAISSLFLFCSGNQIYERITYYR